MRQFLITLVLCFGLGEAYKILALAPYNAWSHWKVIQPLLEELAKRGNDVTVLSHYPRQTPLENYRDISIYEPGESRVNNRNIPEKKFGSMLGEMHTIFRIGMKRVCHEGLKHPRVQELMRSNDTYDVVITELFNANCFLGFVHKFQAALVAIRPVQLSPCANNQAASLENPSCMSSIVVGQSLQMGFLDRLESILIALYQKLTYNYYNSKCNEIARSHFGEELPSLADITRNTSMILINSHFAVNYVRPLIPWFKEIAGIHLEKAKELPEEIEDWISGAKDGVIFFSLGSMLKSSTMSSDKRSAFLQAFAQLPQRVLMKWEDSTIDNLPDNVKLFPWVPQYDVLCHPNVKVFISHGGMLSTIESVYSGTPSIMIPAYGDQPTNAALLQEKGMAIVLEYRTITKDILLTAIRKILQDPKYQETAELFSKVVKDRLVPPVEEAAYWVEYVARYKGTSFSRSPALDLPLYQYLHLDVLAALFFVILVILVILALILKSLFKLFFRKPLLERKATKEE